MLLPVHGVRLLSDVARPMTDPLAIARHALDGPLLATEPVYDAAGVAYAYDLVVQDGAYLLFACMGAWLIVRERVRRGVQAFVEASLGRRPGEDEK